MNTNKLSYVEHAYTTDHLWNTLEEVVTVGSRMAGTNGERRGTEVLERTFADIGDRSTVVDEFTIPGWQRGSATVAVPSRSEEIAADHEIVPLAGTTSADITAPLVDLGHGLPSDFETADTDGAIVMTTSHTPNDSERSYHRLDKYVQALEADAAGFVYSNYRTGCLPLAGEVGWHSRPSAIPAVGVSAEVSDRLARYCRDGSPRVRLQVACERGPATSRNVETVIGPDEGREVLLTAHVDTYEISEGARDNGVGCALVAEIGRLLTHVSGTLSHPVRLVVFGAEEIGMRGAYHWVETHDLENVKCVINVDGAGDTRDLRLMTNGFDSMETPFDTVTERLSVPLRTESEPNTTTDGWPFAAEGVPAVTVASDRQGSGRGWGHTHADTLDKLDPRVLRDLAIVLTGVVRECASDEFSPNAVSPSTVRRAIDARTEKRMRTLGQLPAESRTE